MPRMADSPLRAYFAARPEETHAAVAARAGIPIDTLRSYVAGRRTPGVDAAVAIERATGGAVPVESWASAEALAASAPSTDAA